MTWDSTSQSTFTALAPLRIGQAYGVKLIEFGVGNVKSTLEFLGALSSAKSPSDFAEAFANETRRRLEALERLSGLFRASANEAAESANKATESAFKTTESATKAVHEASEELGFGE